MSINLPFASTRSRPPGQQAQGPDVNVERREPRGEPARHKLSRNERGAVEPGESGMQQEDGTRDEECFHRLAPKHGDAGRQGQDAGTGLHERAGRGGACHGQADARAAGAGQQQSGQLGQLQLINQILVPRAARAREPPCKDRQTHSGQDTCGQEEARRLSHVFTIVAIYWPPMRALDIIRLKRDGHVLSREAIKTFAGGVADSSWPDYQVTAMLMAIFLRGMTLDEATVLTQAMAESGARLDPSDVLRPENGSTPVDKHSTGGVGDKASLVLAPLAAACGALVPMMSGRGLGHTGGTLDKLAAIPGFRTGLSVEEVRQTLSETGCVLFRQTAEVAPADRRMYALRDVTATVESIPLIASSIISKKVTEGIGALVLDVKVGSGGFMNDLAQARELSQWLVGISERSGLRTEALLTRMDTPLGRRVGNASEVREAIQTLKGEGPEDLESLSVILATRMLILGGVAGEDEAAGRVREALRSGRGVEKFRQIIAAQGGEPRVIDDPALLPLADREALVRATKRGVITRIDAGRVGHGAVALGAGRDHADAAVDPGVGIDLLVDEGATVNAGEPVMRVYYRDTASLEAALVHLQVATEVGEAAPPQRSLVMETIDGRTIQAQSL